MNQKTDITVEVDVFAPIEKVWEFWKKPEHIVHWAFASDDWEALDAENNLCTGGKFKTVMAAKDGSLRFDFTGVYTNVKERVLIEYDIDDGRKVSVRFENMGDAIKVIETFEPEKVNTEEIQRNGWQAMLDNFKKYVEGNK